MSRFDLDEMENHHGRKWRSLATHKWARDGVPMDCPRIAAHTISRQPFWIPRLFLQRTRQFGERNPARRAPSVDAVASSSYFSRVKRLRPWAILLILDVAAVYPHISRLAHIPLGRRPPAFCRLFTSHASCFSNLFLFIFFSCDIYRVFKNKRMFHHKQIWWK